MNSLIDISKSWEGRVVDGKLPLQKWLGGSEHSAVFLTDRGLNGAQKSVVKLIPVENYATATLGEDVQLFRWADIAKLSHPHLMRLFESGRCRIDDTNFLYVVMEYAEEDLGQVLPQRALSPEEAKEMLPPTVDALTFVHRAGFVHGRLKPSNIMAVGNQLKISADSLGKNGESAQAHNGVYDAPEVSTTGLSPATDIWSLGVMLVAILTQREPNLRNRDQGQIAIPETISRPFHEIARRCLQLQPQQRGTLSEVLSRLKGREPSRPVEPAIAVAHTEKLTQRWTVLAIAVVLLLLAIFFGRKFLAQPAQTPAAETHSAESPVVPASPAGAQSAVPVPDKAQPTTTGNTHGSVLQQVLPAVSRGAQNTIHGRIKVGVQVSVDASGNVTQTKLISPGPSRYFANHALAAARGWKFNAPATNGRPSSSEWILRFQFGRTSTQVFPAETKP
ncbi:MAG: TonB family protein [Candidatus Sulfotelmatobacter sp.]